MRALSLLILGLAACAPSADLNEADASARARGSDKVTICHYPPGNPANVQTITISVNALDTHLMLHGDEVGPCDGEPVDTSDTGEPPDPCPENESYCSLGDYCIPGLPGDGECQVDLLECLVEGEEADCTAL